MARPHLDWQQLGSLQFSPCADQMGTLTEPTMSQPIMKFAYSATAANQTVPVNAAPALALQPQNEQPYESSYFFPPHPLFENHLENLWPEKQCIQCPAPLFLPTVPMKGKKYDHNSIPRFIYSLCTSWILKQRCDCWGRRFSAMLGLRLLLSANSCW